MKKLFLIFWNCLLLGLVMGCSDFLEPKSSDEYIPENAAALDEMLVEEVYTDPNAGNTYMFQFHNIFDDDVTVTDLPLGFRETEQLKGDAYFALYTLQPDMFFAMNEGNIAGEAWDEYYQRILGCNVALDYLDKMNDAEDSERYVAAQALALRAFNYFQLVNLFGAPYNYNPKALGVPLKLKSGLTTDWLTRNTVGEVYDQICRDLACSDSLFRLLPSDKQFKQDYRINLPAVRFLRSRVYLYMENYEEAIRWADSVLLWKEFQLYDLQTFVSSPDTPKPHYGNYTSGEVLWCYGSSSDLTRLTLTQADEYVDGIRYNPYRFFNASSELLEMYAVEDSLRKDLYIFDEYSNNTWTGKKLAVGKVYNIRNQIVQSANNFGMSFRLSELYLNLAEAHAMLGNSEKALFYLNELRSKRIKEYKDVVGISGEELIQFVREERRRELCFEGHRWFDLRRWGMESFTRKWKLNNEPWQNYVIEKNDPAFTLPIPDEVIEQNPGLEQNPLASERHEAL